MITRFATYALLLLVFGARIAAAQQAPSLRLPPSLERELKLKGANIPRVVRFSDTVKADKRIAQSLRDTSGRELDSTMVHDSAVVLIDSAVSLTHKEWLDSMLAELPETERTPEGLRFHYPDRMMVSTARRQVPFDTTLPLRMDPVSKEDLPLFDELSRPTPITAKEEPRYSLRLGVGTPYAPSIEAGARLVNSSSTSLDVGASFVNRIAVESPYVNEWGVHGHGVFTFSSDWLGYGDPVPLVTADLGARSLSRDLLNDSGRAAAALTRTRADVTFEVGTLGMLRATGGARLHYFTDNAGSGLTERSGGFDMLLEHQAHDSANRIGVNLGYEGASGGPASLGGSSSLGVFQASATIGSRPNDFMDWQAGISVIDASDAVANTVYLFPKLQLSKRLTNNLTLFASLGHNANATSLDGLAETNPFFAPLQQTRDTGIRSLLLRDIRRATVDKYAAGLGANYFLSNEDYLHVAIGFGTRHNEVSFASRMDSGGITRYYAFAEDTRFFTADIGASLLFFKNDKLTFDTHFASTHSVNGDKQLPFVPIVSATASYTFGSLFERVFPMIGTEIISRSDANYLFVNLGADYRMSEHWRLEFRLDNLLGSDGAYWIPYGEHLRRLAIFVTGRL